MIKDIERARDQAIDAQADRAVNATRKGDTPHRCEVTLGLVEVNWLLNIAKKWEADRVQFLRDVLTEMIRKDRADTFCPDLKAIAMELNIPLNDNAKGGHQQ